MKEWIIAGLLAIPLFAGAARADPDPLPPLTLASVMDTPAPANPAKAADAFRLTLYWENDGGWAKPFDSNDRHYTAGDGATLSWRAPWVDRVLSLTPTICQEFDPAQSDYAMGFVGALTIYTPENFGITAPITNDRPFAGYTYAGLYFQRANRTLAVPAYESMELDLGMVGPSSLAQNAQEMVHHKFDYVFPKGWVNQIHDEVEFSIKYNRRWLFEPFHSSDSHTPAWLQILPDAGFTAGTLLDEVHIGTTFRAGLNLQKDFGTGTLNAPADFTSTPSTRGNPFEQFWTNQTLAIFIRPYGQLVAHNVLLQGDNWRHDDPVTVTPEPALFGAQCGVTWRFLNYLELGYVLTTDSPEFKGQHGWDSWSSVQFSFTYAW